MLNFLRKHQKIIFGVVTCALIVSIVFFGSSGARMQSDVQEKDHIIGTAIDGSSISKLSIEKMMRFLSTDERDQDVRFSGRVPNFFNDGVIKNDFIETGFAKMLTEHYFEFLSQDLADRLDRQKSFRGYQHPSAPFISAEGLWTQMLPSLGRHLGVVRAKEFTLTKDNLDVLFDLYKESHQFSTDLLRQFLGYQQERYEWIAKDPYLARGDLSLFHFHDIEDWFGPSFNQMICQAIHNISLYAKQKGIKVSPQEAKADLFKNGYTALSAHSTEKITNELLADSWRQVLASCKVTEKEAIAIWQKVLLCKKIFQEEKQAVLVDRLCDNDYAQFAEESREIKLYTLPSEFQFKDFLSLMKFQIYLEAIAKSKKEASQCDLPHQFKSKEEIAKTSPELLIDTFEVSMKQIKASDLMQHVSYKSLMDWQAEHIAQLKIAFEELALLAVTIDPLEALDQVSDEIRSKIDHYSLRQMLKEKPSIVETALKEAKEVKKELTTSILHDQVKLEGISDAKQLIALFEQKKEVEPLRIENYSQDKEHFYTFEVISKSSEPELLTYKKAKELGVLDKMLDQRLEKNLEAAKSLKPHLFANEKGEAKTFEMVKTHIAAYCFKDLLEQLDKHHKVEHKKETYDHYADLRLLNFVQKAKEDIVKTDKHSSYLLPELFCHLEVRDEKVQRKDKKAFAQEDLFDLKEGDFSTIQSPQKGELCFYQIINTKGDQQADLAKAIEKKQKLLGDEAQKKLMAELAKELIEKEALHLEQVR